VLIAEQYKLLNILVVIAPIPSQIHLTSYSARRGIKEQDFVSISKV
jgi:hypothetical protein